MRFRVRIRTVSLLDCVISMYRRCSQYRWRQNYDWILGAHTTKLMKGFPVSARWWWGGNRDRCGQRGENCKGLMEACAAFAVNVRCAFVLHWGHVMPPLGAVLKYQCAKRGVHRNLSGAEVLAGMKP